MNPRPALAWASRAPALLALVGLGACGGPPAGIPDSPGTIDAATLPDLITIGSPDLPFLLWLTPIQLAEEDWRACPQVTRRDDGGVTAVGNGCVDSSNVQWFGTASLSWDPEDRRETVILNDFGADDDAGGWTADGRVSVTYVDSNSGFLVDSEVTMTSLANEQSLLMWASTSSAYTTYGGVWYADRHDGHVGLADWGTAEVTSRNVALSFVYDCGWAAHLAGTMSFGGANDALVDYYTGPLSVSLPPPADTGDTADTAAGETGDTADTADTGETGDTDTDTDTDDTDTDTDPTPDFDDDDDPDGSCGTCRDAAIGQTELAECLDLNRSFSWPFPPPF